MKKHIILLAALAMIFSSCNNKKTEEKPQDEKIITKENREIPDFSKGVLTEEILWYMGRVSAQPNTKFYPPVLKNCPMQCKKNNLQ